MFVRQPQNVLRHFVEIGIFEHQAAKRITSARIETRRNDDQIGRKLSFDFMERVRECLPMMTGTGAGGEGDGQRISFTGATASLPGKAGAWIVPTLGLREIEEAC